LAQGQASITEAPPRAPAQAWRDLRQRTASALVIAPLCLAALWWGGDAWQILLALLTLGMGAEWSAMCRRRGMGFVARMVSGLCYIAPGFVALLWMRAVPEFGFGNVLFVLFVVWASDIGAYLAGRLFGGPKLAPRISPGKTRSGAVGGLVCAIAVGLIAAAMAPGGRLAHAAVMGGFIGIASQLGDLLESGLKRYFGVKDSGRLIPGHGGLLDRLDGLLIAAPVAAIVLRLLGESVFWR
jgi:phosphatidate cytidylyltransferase